MNYGYAAPRTIADLAGARSTQVTHVAEAMQYRRALRGAA